MNILIIDDEKLTREGLSKSIDWEKLEIDHVFLAEDGRNGLEVAKKYRPQIILSDIRMPHMDGIHLAEKIQEFSPNTSIIFMSGYSDKAYLKAAIKLKAISYVEKPINKQEVENAISEAMTAIKNKEHIQETEQFHQQEQNSRLALSIAYNREYAKQEIYELVRTVNISINEEMYFTTCLVSFQKYLSDINREVLSGLLKEFHNEIEAYSLKEIHAYKNDKILMIHIYSRNKPQKEILQKCCLFLQKHLPPISLFFIALGDTVRGIWKVYESYNSAVILLQSSFFNEYNEILTAAEKKTDSGLLKDWVQPFSQGVYDKKEQLAKEIVQNLYDNLRNCQSLLPSQVKDIYYKYFIQIQNAAAKHRVELSQVFDDNYSIWEAISNCNTLRELHELLEEKLDLLFQNFKAAKHENPIIYEIKEFICKHYANETLSVKDISEHVYLSSSYVCTLFKNETGRTLNQYITDYRVEMAKLLLSDTGYKISEISSKVGYGDGNYFSKTFKKIVGLSPSEYRDKVI